MDNLTTWPPRYQVRYSAKARNVFIQISTGKLEVVIPQKRLRAVNIEALLTKHRTWIERTLKKKHISLNPTVNLPERLEYQALNEQWSIAYEQTLSQRITLLERPGGIVLLGDIRNQALCAKRLTEWCFHYAKAPLTQWLKHLSLLTQLPYRRVSIRRQVTLWGSCNQDKCISLNYKLIFLPRPLAQHILLHELAHTQYLNHSTRFWKLLRTLDPQCEENKHAIKSADRYLPNFLTTS